MNTIEITAKIAKTAIDPKKATITLELKYESWGQIPNIARMAGSNPIVAVTIEPMQGELELS